MVSYIDCPKCKVHKAKRQYLQRGLLITCDNCGLDSLHPKIFEQKVIKQIKCPACSSKTITHKEGDDTIAACVSKKCGYINTIPNRKVYKGVTL